MISAPTGGRPKVIGSSMATVAMVPMPGSTPTSVPTSAPIRQKSDVHRHRNRHADERYRHVDELEDDVEAER